ncbi:hypothetical protein ACFQ0R_04405 [Psychroflexus salinarum]|uniref:Acetyltransferase (GNAT) domain-containing protein n=1 Tax=Psychroflexus salinarum TaxID=546024 RepID=A0ABW3GMK3_9FLAO
MLNDQYVEESPELESQRLILRELNLKDAAKVQTILSDERVMVYMDQERHKTVHSLKSLFPRELFL